MSCWQTGRPTNFKLENRRSTTKTRIIDNRRDLQGQRSRSPGRLMLWAAAVDVTLTSSKTEWLQLTMSYSAQWSCHHDLSHGHRRLFMRLTSTDSAAHRAVTNQNTPLIRAHTSAKAPNKILENQCRLAAKCQVSYVTVLKEMKALTTPYLG